MKKLMTLAVLISLGACSDRDDEVTVPEPDGAEHYALYCAGCHDPGPGHGGTMLLAEKGAPVPSLIGREDLQYDYLHAVVRNGLIEMPPFRPTELSDEEIEEIYEHIMSQELPANAGNPASS